MSRRKNKVYRLGTNAPVNNVVDDPEKYRAFLSEEDFSRLEASLQKPLEPALRINSLKVDPHLALEDWKGRYAWQVRNVPYCDTGWWVTHSPTPISQAIEHRLGFYYIQDAASMLPVELFTWQTADRPLVLDMAASPGGKTTHLVSKTGDQGLVMANDSSHSRITALRLVLQTWGAASSVVTSFPGEKFGDWFPDTFDQVLLDAPCSMHNLRSTENHPARPISDKERASLAVRQARMLASAFIAVKPGGQVVYSTCTLAPEEDEAVLQTLLERFPGVGRVENVHRLFPVPAPALSSYGGKIFEPQVQQAVRLWPHLYDTSGFFAAMITKSESVNWAVQSSPSRPLEKTGLERLAGREQNLLDRQLIDQFGYDPSASLEMHNLSLWKRGSVIFAIPNLFLQHFRNFPFEAAGLLLGEQTPQDFQLSHEWVARFGMLFKLGRYCLPEETIPAWLRGEDIHGLSMGCFSPGRMVVVEDRQGRLLGRGKLQVQRLKNLLPRRLV
jgi:16S rRNA (cytosine1407-C5)-methyltransferase